MTKKRLSVSPSFGNLSLRSTSVTTRNMGGVSHRTLDPTVVDNDFEAPTYSDVRIRPSPDFIPIKDMKPKLLKAVKKEKVQEKPKLSKTPRTTHEALSPQL